MATRKSTRQPADSPLPDRATLDKRLTAARTVIFEAQAIIATARAAVSDMDDGDGSDADYALGVACRMLTHVTASDLDAVVMLAPEQAQVSHGQA